MCFCAFHQLLLLYATAYISICVCVCLYVRALVKKSTLKKDGC